MEKVLAMQSTKKDGAMRTLLCLVAALALALACSLAWSASAGAESEPTRNPYESLNLAAQITKIGDEYFIEDGYNNQIIYSSDLDAPLTEWKVMASGLNRGHSVAGHGKYYLADDTDNHRFLAYEREGDEFTQIKIQREGDEEEPEELACNTGAGSRPHYVVYDENTQRFYGLVSMTGEIYVFATSNSGVALERTMQLPELNGIYVRSFSIIDGEIYFISGNNNIIRTSIDDLSVIERIPVPNIMRSMVNIMKAGDYFYITVSGESVAEQNQNAAIVRTKSLKGLTSYDFENVTHFFGTGIPYYLSTFDGKYYLAMQNVSTTVNSRLFEFGIEQEDIAAVRVLF